MFTEGPTYYERLSVDAGASAAEIRSAYRALAWQWHPDRSASQNLNLAEAMQAKSQQMAQINAAYDVLRDPHRRAIYDQMLRIATFPIPKDAPVADAETRTSSLARRVRWPLTQPLMRQADAIKRWALGFTVVASGVLMVLWVVDLFGAADHEMMAAFQAVPDLSGSEVLPHLLDGDPLRLSPSWSIAANHLPQRVRVADGR